MFERVPGDNYRQEPEPGIAFAEDEEQGEYAHGNPACIKDEVYPLEVEHADNAVGLRTAEPKNVNLDHLGDMFCKVHALANNQDEKESQPVVLAIERSCFDDPDGQPGDQYEYGDFPQFPSNHMDDKQDEGSERG